MKCCVQRFPPEPLCHCHSKAFVFWKMFSSAVRVLSLNYLSNPDTPPKEVRNLVACSMMPSSTKVPRSRSRGDAIRDAASRSTAASDAVNPGGASAVGGDRSLLLSPCRTSCCARWRWRCYLRPRFLLHPTSPKQTNNYEIMFS